MKFLLLISFAFAGSWVSSGRVGVGRYALNLKSDILVTDWVKFSTPLGPGVWQKYGCELQVFIEGSSDFNAIVDLDSMIPEPFEIDHKILRKAGVVGQFADLGKRDLPFDFKYYSNKKRAYGFRVPIKNCNRKDNNAQL